MTPNNRTQSTPDNPDRWLVWIDRVEFFALWGVILSVGGPIFFNAVCQSLSSLTTGASTASPAAIENTIPSFCIVPFALRILRLRAEKKADGAEVKR